MYHPYHPPFQPFFSPHPHPIPPPANPFPMSPAHFSRPSMMPIPTQGHPPPHRNRRQLSIGGPPKAVLGGPARKLSPLPVAQATPPSLPPPKAKKLNVNLPKETILEDGKPHSRPPWARTPSTALKVTHQCLPPLDTTTAELYPSDQCAKHMPNTVDVFLPGKRTWDVLKQQAIEEKLEKLGVERGSGSNIPHIHAPHARAASISSPADPQLLLYKLNKLQESQEAAALANLSPSPGLGLSPSPRFPSNRHGHAMSLANMSPHPFYDPSASSFDPFASNFSPTIPPGPSIYDQGMSAPQGRVPVAPSSLVPPQELSRPVSRPDFIRGFGLDIPEEEEEEEEAAEKNVEEQVAYEDGTFQDADNTQDMDLDEVEERAVELLLPAETATASQHSRHVSKLSTTLSIHSAGALEEEASDGEDLQPSRPGQEDMDLEDVIGEWTGSEDVYETSDGESIGEYSNPSDEERARHERLDRRMRRRASRQVDQPRRLPNFPRPPDNTIAVPLIQDDDDIISNPSEEERMESRKEYLGVDYYPRPPSNLGGPSRPLPPLPHSRSASGQHTAHDPAHAHSRAPSNHSQQQTTLNPFAKPFVFGAAGSGSGSWSIRTPPGAPLMTHSRLPSIGRPLNVAAPEFKPNGFTFRLPAGLPQMPLAVPTDKRRPLPVIPSSEPSPYKVQGREKRQRRGSSASMEEDNSMSSFKFPPNPDSPQSIRHTRSASGSAGHTLNPSAEPFTFAGFSAVATLPYVPKDTDTSRELAADTTTNTQNDDSTAKATSEVEVDVLPSTSRPKRTPIPLDFKHPVSNNTVPAGLFKALVNNGDDRTRRTVRSRLGSREIYEQLHRLSMDDTDVPAISHKPRGRLVTDPGETQASPLEDVFGDIRHARRRSSLPDALRDDDVSPTSAVSSQPAIDIPTRVEMPRYDRKMAIALKEGLANLRQALKHESDIQHASTQSMVSELQSLFRTELQASAMHSLEDSQVNARGEMDIQLFKGAIEDGNKELISLIQKVIHEVQSQAWQARIANENSTDIVPVVEQTGNRTVKAVIEAISELSARQEAIGQVASARERDATVERLITELTPVLSSLQSEPIDYEFLTSQLTQAVKPHISQLIDLASDKRETASLIVDSIIPLLPSRQSLSLDPDALILQLTAEVRRAIAPIDAFEIKEQVADLVVERLDSRLAVRDKAFNADNMSGKIMDGVSRLLDPIQGFTTSIDNVAATQEFLSSQHSELASSYNLLFKVVSDLPCKFAEGVDALNETKADLLSKLAQPTVLISEPDENILNVKTIVEGIEQGQKGLVAQTDELRTIHHEILDKLNSLPDTFHAATNALQDRHDESRSFLDATQREMDEIRKLNSDLQIQLTKARGGHGQVRVEKDALSEKIVIVEGERDRLRGQVNELQVSNAVATAQVTTLEARTLDLEEALAQALARLQASDVATQANQDRINELEEINRESASENQALKSKVDALDLQATLVARDKETALQTLATLQQQHDHLSAQQSHWDELHKASEKIDMLAAAMADNGELKELRRQRDRSKVLEGEHAAFQKRLKEQESKIVNSERAAVTARQNLAQAQQRSSEWERRAKDYEAQLEITQTNLDQAEQTHTQLDADYSLVTLQLEEREADNRLAQDQQNKLRDQVVMLEAQVKRLQFDQANLAKTTTLVPPSYRGTPNGNTHPLPRPDSRTSTIYDNHSVIPQRHLQSRASSGRSDTPPEQSVRHSMHAPTNKNNPYKRPALTKPIPVPRDRHADFGPTTPKAARRPPVHYHATTPSPTPSAVSLAPTQGDDGWWE